MLLSLLFTAYVVSSATPKFFIDKRITTQTQGQANCKARGGIIASLHNDAEYYEASLACEAALGSPESGSFTNGAGCWIAIEDRVTEGIWTNADGTSDPNRYLSNDDGTAKRSVFPWLDGEPNDMGGYEDCVHIWSSAGDRLNDQPCDGRHGNYMTVCRVPECGTRGNPQSGDYGLRRPHSCRCKESCDGQDTHCNDITTPAGILGDDLLATDDKLLCPSGVTGVEGPQCCCSCENCKLFEEV